MKTKVFLSLVALGGLVLVGCRQAPRQTTSTDSGNYQLIDINGNELPYAPPHRGGAPLVKASSFTLNPDGTFTNTMVYGWSNGQTTSRGFSGTYTQKGDTLTFRWKGAGFTTAQYQQDGFSMNNEGVRYGYKK